METKKPKPNIFIVPIKVVGEVGLEYEPALSEFQLFHRNEWQEAAFEGDRRKMQKHYLAMKEALGRDFLGTYWDVDEIMSDETKIRKILAEAQYYRDFQAKKRLRK